MITHNIFNAEKYNKALMYLARLLNSYGIDWLLGASGALYVWGVAVKPYDIDIFTSKENVKLCATAMTDFITTPLHDYVEDGKSFVEFQGEINGIPFEVCELVLDAGVIHKSFYGERIYLHSLEAELKYYSAKGHLDRVNLINQIL